MASSPWGDQVIGHFIVSLFASAFEFESVRIKPWTHPSLRRSVIVTQPQSSSSRPYLGPKRNRTKADYKRRHQSKAGR